VHISYGYIQEETVIAGDVGETSWYAVVCWSSGHPLPLLLHGEPKPAHLKGARMKIIIDGLEEGQVAVVAIMGADFYPEEDPDPGEEEDEGEEQPVIRAVIGKVVNINE